MVGRVLVQPDHHHHQDPQQLLLKNDGHGQHGFVSDGRPLDVPGFGVAFGVPQDGAPLGLRHPTGDPLADLHRQIGGRGAGVFFAVGRSQPDAGQRALVVIEQVDAALVVGNQGDDRVANQPADFWYGGDPSQPGAERLDSLEMLRPGTRPGPGDDGRHLGHLAGVVGHRHFFRRQHLEQRPGHHRVELLARLVAQLTEDGRPGERLAIGTVAGHGVVGVAGVDDAGLDGNLLTLEPIRVARPIPAFVFRPHHPADRSQERHRGDNALADHRMLLHDLHLVFGQRPRLVQDVPRHPDLADVVEVRRILEKAQPVRIQPESTADGQGQGRRFAGVGFRVAILGIERRR